MRATTPEDALTVRAARSAFFHASGFGADGGYDDPWAEAAFGPLRYRVPNGPLRAAALRLHDLHHVATGYATDWRGEAEISAWELASGAGRQPYAWLIALWGLFTGLLAHPRPTWAAFRRGRGSRNLYGAAFDERLLDARVGDLKAALAVADDRPATAGGALVFAGWSALALGLGALSLLPAAGLVGLAYAREVTGLWRCPFSCTSAA